MWNTDVVNFQSFVSQNFSGVVKRTWSLNGTSCLCDVQDISREKVLKDYGFTDSTKYKRIFDTSLSDLWVEGSQVEYNGEQYLVRLVIAWNKLGASNNKQVILSKVI